MKQQTDPKEQEAPAPVSRRQRARRGPSRLGVFLDSVFSIVVSLTLFAAVLLVGSLLFLQGKRIDAPDWVREEIAARIALSAPDVQVSFDDVGAMLGSDWRPRLLVSNLDVRNAAGEDIVQFTEVSLSLDYTALMARRFALRSLRAEGVFVTMRRSVEGAFTVQTSDSAGSARREAANLAQFIGEADEILLRPTLVPLQEVEVRAITLRYEDARSKRAWTIDGGTMLMTREGRDMTLNTQLAILGGTADVATLSATYAGVIGETAADFGVTLANLDARDIASQSAAFSWLGALQAPISGAVRGGVDEDGNLRPLNASLEIGSGAIQPTEAARPIPIEAAQSYFTYTPSDQRLNFDAFEIDTQWGRGRLEGYAEGTLGPNGQVQELVGQFQLSDLAANPADFYEVPIQIESAEVDLRLTLAPFALELGRLQIIDQGSKLLARGRADVDAQGWRLSADAELDEIDADRLKVLWPVQVKPKTRRWIGENVYAGTIRGATTALRMAQGNRPDVYLGFQFDAADVRYMRHMPLIEGGRGHASLVDDRFVLMVDEGNIEAPQGGRVQVAGSSFIVPDTTAKPDTPAVVRLTAEASVTAGLSLLDLPPLEVMQKTPLPVDVAAGTLSVDATLSLPLKRGLPIEEVSFEVEGIVRDVSSDILVPNRTVRAQSLALNADETGVSLRGLGTLDGFPLDVVWRQPIGPPGATAPGEVTGTVELTPDLLDAFGITLPPGSVSGRGTADLKLQTQRGQTPTLNLTSDLTGMRLSVPQVGWGKSERTSGALDVNVVLEQVPQVDRLSLSAPGMSLTGTVRLDENRQLDRVRLDRLRVGGWLDAPVDLISRGTGRPLAVTLRGGSLDLRKIDLPPRAPAAQGSPISVALDRVILNDTVDITDVRGGFDTSGGLSGNFEGRVNGQAPITGTVTPQDGRSAIRVRAQDAGAVVIAAGLVQRARGGRMELELLPVGSGGAFDGKLRVNDVRITNAPAMAALLNSISVVGLINELNGDGIYFADVEADFRLSPSQITVREASAVGASLGLSMDGIFVPATGAIQLQGVISPIYALNAVGSVLTRRGEGLFGFNYSITGSVEDPSVFVNPLTALAPGMFRNLFRRAEPEVPLESGEERPPEPESEGYVPARGSDR